MSAGMAWAPADNAEVAEERSKLHYFANIIACKVVLWFICVISEISERLIGVS